MSDVANHVSRVIAVVTLAAGNVGAWWQSVNYGAIVTGATVGGVAAIGLVCKAITDISMAKTRARAESERSEMAIRAERERFETVSLQGQITRLHEAMEENKRRTEDANAKLHDIRNQANVDSLRHTEEVDRLTEQLKETNEELRSSRQEIRTLREEERRLLAMVAVRQEKADVLIKENAAAIVSVAEQTGVIPVVKVDEPKETT